MAMLVQLVRVNPEDLANSRKLQLDLYELLRVRDDIPIADRAWHGQLLSRARALLTGVCSSVFLDHIYSVTFDHPPLDLNSWTGARKTGSGCRHAFAVLHTDKEHVYFYHWGTPFHDPAKLRDEDVLERALRPDGSHMGQPFTNVLLRVRIDTHDCVVERCNMHTGKWEADQVPHEDGAYFETHRLHKRGLGIQKWLRHPKLWTFMYVHGGYIARHLWDKMEGTFLFKVWYRLFPSRHPVRKLLGR